MIQRLAHISTDAIAAFEKESKGLLVRWEPEAITLALADSETGNWQAAEIIQYDAGAKPEDFLQELRQKSTLANYNGLQTQVFIATPHAMLIPAKLENSALLFVKAQFGNKAAAEVFTSVVNEAMIAGFWMESEMLVTIRKLFPNSVIRSSLGLLVQKALLHKKSESSGNQLWVTLSKDLAEMVLLNDGTVLLARSFSFTTNEDVLYHLLNACRVFSISLQEVEVRLQGQVQEQEAIFQLLQTYFAHLQFAGAGPAIQPAAFSQVPLHFFTPLIQAL